MIYDKEAGNLASVAWRPDGKGLFSSDRKGHVTAWEFDPDVDAFDDATVASSRTARTRGSPAGV